MRVGILLTIEKKTTYLKVNHTTFLPIYESVRSCYLLLYMYVFSVPLYMVYENKDD